VTPTTLTILTISLSTAKLILIISLVLLLAVSSLLIYLYAVYLKLKRRVSVPKLKETFKEKELFEQLLDLIPDRIYLKDRESRFIIANNYVSEIMGAKKPSDLVGKTDFDFYDAEMAQPYFDDEQEIMKKGDSIIAKEEKGYDNKGNEIVVSTTKIAVRDKDNRVVGIIGIGRDISAQKEIEESLKVQTEHLKETNVLLEERQEEIQQMAEELNVQTENLREVNEQLERLSLVASRTENVVVIMDGNANFQWVNQGFENKYNASFKQYTTEHGMNLRNNSSYSGITAILNQIYIDKKPFTYTSKSLDPDGNELWNQTNITPITNQDKEITYLILIDSDITDLKKAEGQIKAQKAEIEARTVELQTLNTTKDRLFSIIAHDLKNPFHSIMGFTDLLQKRHKEISREKLSEFLEMISLSTHSAYQLLENLLEWARSQTDRLSIEPESILLQALIEQIKELQKLHASNKEITFVDKVGDDITVLADKNMLNTVIRNITSNAIKYTNHGGSITFKSAVNKNNVVIEITDTGIGIPENKIKELFLLDKVSSTAGTEGETGTGLGLIVCNDFMLKNKGSIDITSEPGKGSSFFLTIPKGIQSE
jgi:PAS domain S-box-containing protein